MRRHLEVAISFLTEGVSAAVTVMLQSLSSLLDVRDLDVEMAHATRDDCDSQETIQTAGSVVAAPFNG